MMVDDAGVAVLDEPECRSLLGRATIGRVAVSIGAVPAVFPINFAQMDGGIVFLTGKGTKFDAAVRNAVIAFETDDFDPLYHEGWSVLVVGTAELLRDQADIDRALAAGVTAWAPGDKDHVVFLRPELITGRRIAVHPERPPVDLLR